jgi:hypothetical protein
MGSIVAFKKQNSSGYSNSNGIINFTSHEMEGQARKVFHTWYLEDRKIQEWTFQPGQRRSDLLSKFIEIKDCQPVLRALEEAGATALRYRPIPRCLEDLQLMSLN